MTATLGKGFNNEHSVSIHTSNPLDTVQKTNKIKLIIQLAKMPNITKTREFKHCNNKVPLEISKNRVETTSVNGGKK